MKMRAGVWWCAAALAVLSSVTANALRPSQVTAARRAGRRLSTLPVEKEVTTHNWLDDVTSASTSLRYRTTIRQEEARPSRKSYRRNPQPVESTTQPIDIQSERNERFQSKRTYSRTRSKPKIEEFDKRESVNVIRPRPRQDRRRVSTQSPFEFSSPALDESKLEVISSNLDEITEIADDRSTTQFRRRNSVLSSTPKFAPRLRNRTNTRTQRPSEPDLLSSGTTNTVSITEKDPIITSNNLRKQKKPRYKTQPIETDTNLTGEGVTPPNEVTNSSQIKEISPSQSELQNSTSKVVEADQSTEAAESASTTIRITKRPLLRGDFKSAVVLKAKPSEEIKEDDNYPESFKALLISKNASTQTSSPPSESLLVKATQHKEFNTNGNNLSASHTASETTQNRTRYRSFKVGSAENKFTGPSAPSVLSGDGNEKVLPKLIKEQPVDSFTKKTNNYRSRTIYARSRKTSGIPTTVKALSSSENGTTQKPLYRFNRKLKVSTTNAPKYETTSAKRLQTTNLLKKTLPRSSYYSRFKNGSKSANSNILEDVTKKRNITDSSAVKISLRPSLQNRYRSRNNSQEVDKPEENETINKDSIESEDLSTAKIVTNASQSNDSSEGSKNIPKLFVLSINSNESDYSKDKPKDEVSENIEEVIKFIVSTPRYHSSFKDVSTVKFEDSSTEQIRTKSVPPITNLQGRKLERRQKEREQNLLESSTSKTSFTRFGEPFSKVETTATNRIIPDSEKPRSRFSSKYRGSYTAEKPNYKPTVPSVTPSTAWLKFFVTYRDLTKNVQEPHWYDEVYNMSTEPGPYIIAATPIIHESSIELIEEEQNEIGSGLKYYSYTQSRSTLQSEDLRVSESPTKSSLIMNVEASNHSPSVTISIFDALAEILTSTPRPQLSSTTDAVPKTNTKTDDKYVLIGVSNNIDVNSVKNLQSLDSVSTSADSTNAIARSVTPDVINTLSHAEKSVTERSDIKNTENITPFPKPTPVSARKPFAIKLLYANTETSSESISTTPDPSAKMPSTEDPMVYKSVSDLFLINNNLLSSELTSMLSNNINNIIQSMDVETQSKITVNMEKLLRNLVPRALETGAPSDVDIFPMTTPYSLEEISDTEVKLDVENTNASNIYSENDKGDDLLQTVTTEFNALILSTNSNPPPFINDIVTEYTLPTTLEIEATTNFIEQYSPTAALEPTKFLDKGTTTPSIVNISSINDTTSPSIPFIQNAHSIDIFNITNSDISQRVLYPEEINDLLDPPQISSRELWVLSRKARLLKLIEDLLQEHKNELATAIPHVDGFETLNSIQMSQRLTNILMNMTSNNKSNNIFLPSTSSPNPMTSGFDSLSTPSYESPTTKASTQNLFLTSTMAATTTDPIIAKILQQIKTEDEAIADDLTTQYNIETTTENTSTLQSTPELKIETTTDAEITMSTETAMTLLSTTTQIFKKVKPPKRDYVIFGILPNNTVIRKNPNDDPLETLTETTPYVIYGVLPNNTIIRKFPNGTRIPRVMQKIDILPISPSSLRNPYSPIHNNPAIVRPQSLPVRESTNDLIPTEISNNGTETELTANTVNNQQIMIPPSAPNITNTNVGVITTTNRPSATKSTASHVLSLRTTTMLPSVDEILLSSISSAIKNEMIISSMTSSTHEPRILTLDIDPETQQIRTEKPDPIGGKAIFKFIPIDEIRVSQQNTNVLKLSKQTTSSSPITIDNGTKPDSTTAIAILDIMPTLTDTEPTVVVTATQYISSQPTSTTTEANNAEIKITNEQIIATSSTTTTTEVTTTEPTTTTTTIEPTTTTTSTEPTTTTTTTELTTTTTTEPTTITTTTTEPTTTTTTTPEPTTTTTTTPEPTTTTKEPTITKPTTTTTTSTSAPITMHSLTTNINQQDAFLLEALLQAGARNGKNLNITTKNNSVSGSASAQTSKSTKSSVEITSNLLQNFNLNDAKFIQTLLTAGDQKPTTPLSMETTTVRSIEDDIKQFEEDAKFLKALLQATGRNPSNLNLPNLENLIPQATTVKPLPTTPKQTTTIQKTSSDSDRLLQALLMATVQTNKNNVPIISKVTSNVRVSSMTSPIPKTEKSTHAIFTTTQSPRITSAFTMSTFQPPAINEDIRISTLRQSSTDLLDNNVITGRRVPQRFVVTTDTPSTSTFSAEDDFKFLQNLKSVLNANANADPETELANRIIALAVERSLNDITSGNKPENIGSEANTFAKTFKTTTTTTSTTTPKPTTTQRPTTTTQRSTTTTQNPTPSIEEDIKQFQEDTKLLQALLKATGQNPATFNLPTITSAKTNVRNHSSKLPIIPTIAAEDLTLLSNLLSSPSPLNEPFDSLTVKPLKPTITATNRQKIKTPPKTTTTRAVTSTKSSVYGTKQIRGNQKSTRNEEMLLQSLIKLQGVQEATTLNAKTITGQISEQTTRTVPKTTNTISETEGTQTPLGAEYGKTNDALLAALLKEQGFGPTTANSLDEQLRLAALLNQVVVTPKLRRKTTTTPLPPPPPARRPVLDGLAWLWQTWRETAPGPGPARPNRRPAASPSASMTSSASTSNRVNWFGSGPFVGNAEPSSNSNRIPLDPPRAVSTDSLPARGQLVSAAINVTRAFSQFLGAALQGAAQTVQNVIKAGQRAASDVYGNGSG